jgi:hypothetical protein
MGCPIAYQAVPESSPLYAALRCDKQIGLLFARLFINGGGPFRWHGLQQAIRDIGEQGDIFHSPEEAVTCFERLLRMLDWLKAADPEIEARGIYLDKSQWEIEERLSKYVATQNPEMVELIEESIFGVEPMTAPDVVGTLGGPMRFLPSAKVKEVAKTVGPIEASPLFDEVKEDYLCDDYGRWRAMYLAAAMHGEAVLIGD